MHHSAANFIDACATVRYPWQNGRSQDNSEGTPFGAALLRPKLPAAFVDWTGTITAIAPGAPTRCAYRLIRRSMTAPEYDREYRYLVDERLGMICEDSRFKSGQRPATPADIEQARREAAQMMDRIEEAERRPFRGFSYKKDSDGWHRTKA